MNFSHDSIRNNQTLQERGKKSESGLLLDLLWLFAEYVPELDPTILEMTAWLLFADAKVDCSGAAGLYGNL